MSTNRFDPEHVAVVTGAARGIGLGIARHLAQQGLPSRCSIAMAPRWRMPSAR